MKMIKKYLYSSIILSFIFGAINAQYIGSSGLSDPVSVSLGNTYTARPDGIYSIGKNPANLAFLENSEMYCPLPIPEISVSAGTDFMNIDEFNYFFGGDGQNQNGETIGRYLTPKDVTRFKDLFENGNNVNGDISIRYLAFTLKLAPSIGVFGFSISDRVSVNASVPRDLVELMDGNEIGKEYSLSDLRLNSWYVRDYTLSYGRDLSSLMPDYFNSFSAGISLKLLHGFSYSRIESSGSSFQVTDDARMNFVGDLSVRSAFSPDFGVKYDFEEEEKKSAVSGPFHTPAGTGFGLDLGVTAKMFDYFTFAISVTDIGSIKWDKETANYISDTKFTLDGFFGKDNYSDIVDSALKTLEPKGEYAKEFSSDLPTALHIGAAFSLDKFLAVNFPGTMDIYADYHQGFNEMPLNSLTPRFALGVDWKPAKWFAFRNGISAGGIEGFNWSAGIGFDTGALRIDFATQHFHSWLNGNSAKRVSLLVGSRWIF